MKLLCFIFPAFAMLYLLAATAGAQQTVQLPSIAVNAVQTAVSVPDRGSAFLGGVSRGATSFNHYGFSPIGSAVGRAHSNAAQSVFVTIHDFEAADRILLSAPRRDRESQPHFRNARAKSAWNQLQSQK